MTAEERFRPDCPSCYGRPRGECPNCGTRGPEDTHARFRAVDLFGGAGGAHLGLLEAGYTTTSYDNWPPAIATQHANGHHAHLCDLSTDDPPAPDRPWLMWASPPCQPFSAAGDGGGEADDRDGIPWWLRILGRQLPDVAIMENVPGLTFTTHQAYLASMLGHVRDLDYDHQWRILNSADYGVPQTRRRFFLIARRDGGPIVWPTVTHTRTAGLFTEQWVSMADALGWADTIEVEYIRGAGMVERHGERPRRKATDPAFTLRAGSNGSGVNWRLVDTRTLNGVIDANTQPTPTVTGVTGQWVHDRPATTIAGDIRVFAPGWHDPEESGSQGKDAIPVTIPELAALQDFPDGYIFTGTKTDQARQIGNAVPPTLARLLAAANRPVALHREGAA